MAKIIPSNLDPRARHFARGIYYTRRTKWGMIAQKWPRKGFQSKSNYDYYRNTEFGIAARWAASPLGTEYENALALSKGSTNTWRDLLVSASFGSLIEIQMLDGTILQQQRKMTSNPQYMLDLVTEEPGSVVVRTVEGWIGVGPGLPGQVLMSTGFGASWQNQGAGPAAAPWVLLHGAAIPNPTANIDVDVGLYNEALVIGRNITAASSTSRTVSASVDGGATFLETSGDYKEIPITGVEGNKATWGTISAASAAARSLLCWCQALRVDGAPKLSMSLDSPFRILVGSLAPVTNLRIKSGVANMTGGSLYVFGR